MKKHKNCSLLFYNTTNKKKVFQLSFPFFLKRKVKWLSTFLSFLKIKRKCNCHPYPRSFFHQHFFVVSLIYFHHSLISIKPNGSSYSLLDLVFWTSSFYNLTISLRIQGSSDYNRLASHFASFSVFLFS